MTFLGLHDSYISLLYPKGKTFLVLETLIRYTRNNRFLRSTFISDGKKQCISVTFYIFKRP